MKSVWLNELTWQDVEAYLKDEDIILIPVGSTEQHGPAGPLGLDTYVSIALAEDAAKKTGVLVTPPIWFGDSAHHLGFPGTISIKTNTLAEYVKDIIRSLVKHGFKKIVIINGHKITNLSALNSAIREMKEFEFPDVFFAVIDPIKIGVSAAEIRAVGEHHAGALETSHIMYKFPKLIKNDKLPKENPDFKEKYSRFMKSDLYGKGDSIDIAWSSAEQRDFTKSGAMSDATGASPKMGKEYHEKMLSNIVEFINWLKST